MAIALRSDASGTKGAIQINGIDQLVLNSSGLLQAVADPPAADNSQTLATTAWVNALAAHGRCRLTFVGTTQLKLASVNGNILIINGVPQKIPGGGVTISNAGLVASTVYYIYAYMNGAVMTLEPSTTGHSTDAATGVEIKAGDATRTLVGMEYSSASAVWAGLCRSWFNDQGYVGQTWLTSTQVINGNVSNVEVNSGLRIPFLSFAGESVFASADGTALSNVAGSTSYSKLAFDGTSPEENGCGTAPYNGMSITGFSVSVCRNSLSEGYHYVTLLGDVSGSFSGSWTGSGTKGNRCAVRLTILPHK